MNILGRNLKKSVVKSVISQKGTSLTLKPKIWFSKQKNILNEWEDNG